MAKTLDSGHSKKGDIHMDSQFSLKALHHLNGISDIVITSLAGFKDAK